MCCCWSRLPYRTREAKSGLGGVVSDVDQGGVHLNPLVLDLAVDLGGAQQLLLLQALRQGGEIEEVGGGAQLLGHEADVFVGLVVAGRDAGISHQGEDISDGAAGLGIFLQPGHQLADQVAPAYPQAAAPICRSRSTAPWESS